MQDLIQSISNYQTKFAVEKEFVSQFLFLLQHPRAFHRDHLPGHITASAWIIDRSKKFALLTHHAKLNRWLQPGGHADGDTNVIGVAYREAQEETGLKNIKLLNENIFDLDIHSIPSRKEFPEHLHYDIRFLFEADVDEPLIITEESFNLAWIRIDQLKDFTQNNFSILRMAEKI